MDIKLSMFFIFVKFLIHWFNSDLWKKCWMKDEVHIKKIKSSPFTNTTIIGLVEKSDAWIILMQ